MVKLTKEEIEARKAERQKNELFAVIKRFFLMFLISAATKDSGRRKK